MRLPKLYGLDSKGGIKSWEIEYHSEGFTVRHGKLGGKIQTRMTNTKPKNVGRANETTIAEQGEKEAHAKWQKQIDKGYLEDITKLEEAPEILNPMLAMDYKKAGHRIDYSHPDGVYVQPKLDGVRCEVSMVDGQMVFKSRGGKNYPAPEHIVADLLPVFEAHEEGLLLDGELYVHGLELQDIVSAVKKPTEKNEDGDIVLKENHKSLSFYCFDLAIYDRPWNIRNQDIHSLKQVFTTVNVEFVSDFFVESEEEVMTYHDEFVANGYEGAMVRQGFGEYKHNYRSPWLQKYKVMQDAEFKIIGHEVDKDGCIVWVVEVPAKTGQLICKVTPKMTKVDRKNLVEVAENYYGKLLKVQFQARTKDGNLQFPVGIELDRTDNA